MYLKSVLPLMALVILSVSGCGTFLAVEGTSAVLSGKTASDHVVSLFSGKDCSVAHSEQGRAYCSEDEIQQPQPTLYCYKTLAAVTCYTKPDPSRPPDQIVGNNLSVE